MPGVRRVKANHESQEIRTKASRAVQKLLDLQPPTAHVLREGKELEVPIDDVKVGEWVRVRPGESIPVDGTVLEGASGVDESLVTGESIPEQKSAGEEVIGGSINQSGSLLIEVTKVGAESFLQKVARYIEEARAMKPSILELVDVVLKYFVPGVITFGGLAFLIWTLGAWAVTGEIQLARAIFATLAVFVMGYPCALGMASPLAMIRGNGEAARKGILIRSGDAFQTLKDMRKIVFDKTGTLTAGKPALTDLLPADGIDGRELLRLAAAVEVSSEHPLARAIMDRVLEEELEFPETQGFRAIPGKGAEAVVEGRRIRVGSLRFLSESGVSVGSENGSAGRAKAESLEAEGKSVVGVSTGGTFSGLIAIADTVKPDAREAVSRLKGAGVAPVMISGDNRRTARAAAALVGIDEVLAEVLPDEKAAQVRAMQADGTRMGMVGDGINDAPALMQADIGIAVGAGTDIVLVGEKLAGVADALSIGRSSYRKTVQNLFLAFSFNGIGVPAAVTGLVHPAWAMIVIVASVSTVLINSFAELLLPRTAPTDQSDG